MWRSWTYPRMEAKTFTHFVRWWKLIVCKLQTFVPMVIFGGIADTNPRGVAHTAPGDRLTTARRHQTQDTPRRICSIQQLQDKQSQVHFTRIYQRNPRNNQKGNIIYLIIFRKTSIVKEIYRPEKSEEPSAGEIRKVVKTGRTFCRGNTEGREDWIPASAEFGDAITVGHKVLSEGNE